MSRPRKQYPTHELEVQYALYRDRTARALREWQEAKRQVGLCVETTCIEMGFVHHGRRSPRCRHHLRRRAAETKRRRERKRAE